MAEGWAKHLGDNILESYSAGTHPTDTVNPIAIAVMKEVGIDLASHHPKLLTEIPYEIDILITMGCGVECPFLPNDYKEDWGLEDPVGKPIEEFRRTRNIIRSKVLELIKKIEKEGLKSGN
jgi:arsenate reductase